MLDTHSVFGGDVGTSPNATLMESWVDDGQDEDISSDWGPLDEPAGSVLTFTNTDTSSDVGAENQTSPVTPGYIAKKGGKSNSAAQFHGWNGKQCRCYVGLQLL